MRNMIALILLGIAGTASLGQDAPPPIPDAPPPIPGDRLSPRVPADFATQLQPRPFDPIVVAGLPPGAKPIVLGRDNAYRLALARAEGGAAIADPVAVLSLGGKLTAAEYGRLRAALLANRDDRADPAFRDPTSRLADLVRLLHSVETRQRRVASLETILDLYRLYVQGGASSGISDVQVEQVAGEFLESRRDLTAATMAYRDALDDFKAEYGLPPGTPVVPDDAMLDGFNRVFADLGRWAVDEGNNYDQLAAILKRLPARPDMALAGRSLGEAVDREPDAGAALIDLATKGVGDDRDAFRVRKELRALAKSGLSYAAEQARYGTVLKQCDGVLQRIIAPPATTDAAGNAVGQAVATSMLLKSIGDRLECEDRLIASWLEAQGHRLAVGRALGTLPQTRDEFAREFEAATPAAAPSKR